MANIHWQDVFKVLIHLPKHAIRHIYLFIYFFLFFFVVTCSWPKAKVQVRDCRASLWTTSVRWVMSCCWAWCLMYSSVRTWSRDGWGWGGQYSCPVQADKSLEWWVCVCVCELTDIRVSQYPCLWLRFHRLTDSWLSLLLLRSPWANRTPNREKARTPWRRILCCSNNSLHYTSGNSHTSSA